MVSSRNVDEVVAFLKKELIKTHDQEYEKVRVCVWWLKGIFGYWNLY